MVPDSPKDYVCTKFGQNPLKDVVFHCFSTGFRDCSESVVFPCFSTGFGECSKSVVFLS
jgi:O-acetyl-ADP-ribose deacetylase (regulator of RNase III)